MFSNTPEPIAEILPLKENLFERVRAMDWLNHRGASLSTGFTLKFGMDSSSRMRTATNRTGRWKEVPPCPLNDYNGVIECPKVIDVLELHGEYF